VSDLAVVTLHARGNARITRRQNGATDKLRYSRPPVAPNADMNASSDIYSIFASLNPGRNSTPTVATIAGRHVGPHV
jgi:hypothetical protein